MLPASLEQREPSSEQRAAVPQLAIWFRDPALSNSCCNMATADVSLQLAQPALPTVEQLQKLQPGALPPPPAMPAKQALDSDKAD